MLLSNNTKVVLFNENFLNGQPVQHSKCVIVENYEFCLSRHLNTFGEAYGEGAGSTVKIRIRVGSRDKLKVYYERLSQDFVSYFSLLFNVKYDNNDNVNNEYDGGIVVEGYLIDMEESFIQSEGDRDYDESCLTLTILVNTLSCVGSSKNITYDIK